MAGCSIALCAVYNVWLAAGSQDGMMDYFNNQMRLAGLAGPEGEPIISCQVNLDKNFAFLEVCERLLWCLRCLSVFCGTNLLRLKASCIGAQNAECDIQ